MRTIGHLSVAAATTAALSLSLSLSLTPALAEDSPDATLEALDTLSSDVDVLNDVAQVLTREDGSAAIDVVVEDVSVTVPTDPSRAISMTLEDDVPLMIALPFADDAAQAEVLQDGVVAYDNGNGSVTAPVLKSDGSLQIVTVIDGPSAPSRYDYTLSIPVGGRIEALDNGALQLLDQGGGFIGGIAPAWATDADGNAVNTHYEVAGLTVTQVVEHSESDSYPIVADPYLGLQMVQSTAWTTRDPRGRTLVVTPTGWARAFGGAYLAGVYGWPEVESQQPSVRGNSQMQWQYICHQQFAFFKSTWNLDTWVRRGSYLDSVSHSCN